MPEIIDIDKAPIRELPNGRGKSVQLFNPTNGVNNVDIHINTLNPGVTAGGIHYHRYIENVYVILEGSGEIIDEAGKHTPIRAGQAVFFKPGDQKDTHEIYNNGKVPLRLVEIYAPPHPKDAYVGNTLDRTKTDHVIVRDTK